MRRTAVAVGACAVAGGFSPWDLVAAGAVVALWPLQEWLIHVCILHYEPRRIGGRTRDFLVPRKHRAHHRDPWRLDLVFIPLQVYLGVPAVLALVLWLSASSLPRAQSVLAVYFALALHYEWIHFLIHTRYRRRHQKPRPLPRRARQGWCRGNADAGSD